jgi:very-short-patch-repair endonuclease
MQVIPILKRKNPTQKTIRARELRQQSTLPEKILWERLREHHLGGLHFRRQAIIGPFIVDFYCHSAKLVVEVDGGIHSQQKGMDDVRDNYLTSLGLFIMHITNEKVKLELDLVMQEILIAVDSH